VEVLADQVLALSPPAHRPDRDGEQP
jgi:hypothetical protein